MKFKSFFIFLQISLPVHTYVQMSVVCSSTSVVSNKKKKTLDKNYNFNLYRTRIIPTCVEQHLVFFFSFLVVWTIHNFHKKDCRISDHINLIYRIIFSLRNSYGSSTYECQLFETIMKNCWKDVNFLVRQKIGAWMTLQRISLHKS